MTIDNYAEAKRLIHISGNDECLSDAGALRCAVAASVHASLAIVDELRAQRATPIEISTPSVNAPAMLVPEPRYLPGEPPDGLISLIDKEGDEWRLNPNGNWAAEPFDFEGGSTWTYASIAGWFGPLTAKEWRASSED